MDGNDKGTAKFTVVDFMLRVLAALALVLLTYNPTRFCFAHWLRASIAEGKAGAIQALAGVVLLIGWTIFLRTTWASLGALGLVLAGAFFAAAIWVLVDLDVLALQSLSAVIWLALICIAILLAVGMSWGHWKRQASGQVEVDEVER